MCFNRKTIRCIGDLNSKIFGVFMFYMSTSVINSRTFLFIISYDALKIHSFIRVCSVHSVIRTVLRC